MRTLFSPLNPEKCYGREIMKNFYTTLFLGFLSVLCLLFDASAQNIKTLPSSGKLEIKLGKSNKMPVTIYIPEGSGAKPMILVIHTSGGLNQSEHDYAVALQKEGFL